ncbi:uncharacterized protein LOC116004060 [Ipomoea triloba]|uniref:uncharacterized protein LOC116004060 n=1 Tax=Ipomoea triloba TaxID=35885 RepID=UPI00125E85E8|nr:uncharacterized protein LOC116004060 [Ipomoea triloba]
MENADIDTMRKVTVIIWSIWCARNDLVWNNEPFIANQIWHQAEGWIRSWQEAQEKKKALLPTAKNEQGHLSFGLRCFVDAALFENHGLAGYGAIVHNKENQYVGARAGTRICCMYPYLAELWAIKEALS